MSPVARIAFGCILGLLAALGLGRVHARDDGRYANSALHDWFKTLRNPAGMLCCDFADGHRLEDVDWRGEKDGRYSVRIEGNWITLEADQIVTDPNKLGSAVVWIYAGHVTCFMPGAGL